jgi:hypothetical protein
MKTFLNAALLLAAAAVFPAGAQEGVRPKWKLHDSDFAAIKPGAGETDVLRRVGKPILKTTFKRLDETVWDYRYMYGVDTYVAEIHFDMRGQVKRLEHYPDRCSFQAIPCR